MLTTNRLILRELLPTDAADVLTFRGDPEVQRYDDPPVRNVEEARAFIEGLRGDAAEGTCRPLAVVLKETDRVIGGVNLWNWDQYHRRSEIGYGLATQYWGRGLAQEAIRAAALYGFREMDLNRIYARTLLMNERSVRLLDRLGFVREGVQRQYVLEGDGKFYDSAMYGLIKSDWSQP